MSNKTYITDDYSLNDSSIAASSKAVSNGLSALTTEIAGKAPASHASGETAYGLGTNQVYGHVKLSDNANDNYGVFQGIAITPRALRRTVPSGTVVAFAGNPSSSPSGFLICNGSAVSRTTYAELFSAIGTTYGEGDGSTTFNLPDLTTRFIQGSSTAGTMHEAGLPNLHGEIWRSYVSSETGTSGVFTQGNDAIGGGLSGTTPRAYALYFDANNYNSIYGSSNTVQPPALTMRFYIKY